MALLYTPDMELGFIAPEFNLPSTDGQNVSLANFNKHKGLCVIFMCNHCPYVIAVQERINRLAKEFQPQGIAVVGISSNDPNYKEADSFENMKIRAREMGYVFPYLFDETQNVARAYGAVCTPDIFLFKNSSADAAGGTFRLEYRGRIDDSWKDESKVTLRDLHTAMTGLVNGDAPMAKQTPSMGCSIKWKETAK